MFSARVDASCCHGGVSGAHCREFLSREYACDGNGHGLMQGRLLQGWCKRGANDGGSCRGHHVGLPQRPTAWISLDECAGTSAPPPCVSTAFNCLPPFPCKGRSPHGHPLRRSLPHAPSDSTEWLPSAGADAQVRVEHIESETDVTVHLVQAAAPQPPTAARVRRTRIRSPFDVHPPQSNTMLAAHSSSSAAV